MDEARNQFAYSPAQRVRPIRALGVVKADDNAAPTPDADELSRLVISIGTRQDRAAFAVVFQFFGPRLKTFFKRGGATDGVAEDLVQETMLALWRKASYFDPAKAAAATWVFTVARNLRIDHLRRLRNLGDLPPDPAEMPDTAEDALLDAERDDLVRNALDALTTEQLTIIRLSYYGDFSQSEIADQLGIPLGTVKSRTRLAMARLRDLLEDKR